jgi:hypothetical protein
LADRWWEVKSRDGDRGGWEGMQEGEMRRRKDSVE